MTVEDLIQNTQLANSKVFMEGAQTVLGGPIEMLGQWLDGLTDKVRNMEASPSILAAGGNSPMGRLSDSQRTEAPPVNQAKNDPTPDLGLKIEKNQEVAAAVSNANLPWPPKGQSVQATHIDNTEISTTVAQSSLTTGLGGQVQTQSQGLGV